MTDDPKKPTTASDPSSIRERWLRIETALAVAGFLIAVGFLLPWFDTSTGEGRLSGLAFARRGGIWAALFSIPALGVLTGALGLLRLRAARYAGLATAVVMLVAAAFVLATRWPWLYTIPAVVGFSVIALGVLRRGLQASWALGLALLGAVVAALWLADSGEPLLPDHESGVLLGLPLRAAVPLLVLSLAAVASGLALVITGVRKKGRERALFFAGSSIVGLSGYTAALATFAVALATSGVGVWMTALGGVVLLLASRPLATRAGAAEPSAAKAETSSKTEKTTKAKKAAEAKKVEKAVEKVAEKATPAAKSGGAKKPAKADKSDEAENAAKLAKLEQLKQLKLKKLKLKKLKELKAQELAAAEEAKAAEGEEAATAKAGEALANEPEPVFASDPTKPPPPKDEDRDALMRRVGVKKPPPPSDSELEAMLAALKKRTDDD